MKKLAVLFLSAMLLLGGCTTQEKKTSAFKAGTYSATAEGRNGELTVEVVLSADKIESVAVTSHQETEGIADPAIEKIPSAIVEAQGLGIDAVSGCTITSEAILAAASSALTSAGADVEALKEIHLSAAAGEDTEETVDVVVVGGGGAGIAAASSAVEQGASVILV